jgi:hypothetical protein
MTDTPYTLRLRAAADYLSEAGWTQYTEKKKDTGAVCLTGAVRWCSPRNGDEYIIEAVLRMRDRAESRNDRLSSVGGRDYVVGYLSSAHIDDSDIELAFGPRWQNVIAVIRQAASLTPPQYMAVDTALRDQHEADFLEPDVWLEGWDASLYEEWERSRTAVESAINGNEVPAKLRFAPEVVEAAQRAVGAVCLGRAGHGPMCATEDAAVDLYEEGTRAWATVFPEVSGWGA